MMTIIKSRFCSDLQVHESENVNRRWLYCAASNQMSNRDTDTDRDSER